MLPAGVTQLQLPQWAEVAVCTRPRRTNGTSNAGNLVLSHLLPIVPNLVITSQHIMDRYVPSDGGAVTCSSLSRRRESIDISLPKNFDKPLTCFFWHQNGRCNKRDNDCAYAHYHTGHLAAAPINLPGGR